MELKTQVEGQRSSQCVCECVSGLVRKRKDTRAKIRSAAELWTVAAAVHLRFIPRRKRGGRRGGRGEGALQKIST